MHRILLATAPETEKQLLEILSGMEVVVVRGIQEAKRQLMENGFTAVVCDVDFDDSQMFDLYRICVSNEHHPGLPFIGIRLRLSLNNALFENLRASTRILGISDYIDIEEFNGMSKSERLDGIRSRIDRILTSQPVSQL